jgi:hypothetical protein
MTQALDAMIRSLRGLDGETLERRTAQIAAPLLDAAVKKTASAGTTPSGNPWPLKKRGGGQALVDAASHIDTKPYGPIVRQTLKGPTVFHHFGNANDPVRQVIPVSAEEPVVAKALADAAQAAFDEATR